uniref:Contactin-2-like isoform X2 n=1 Tax=Petromyzon marinus TaxID=7757 RepID=A0AAJ7U1Y3_PETMA|nr:contactin-2-like isoform X2 [Petromyzon marinus]
MGVHWQGMLSLSLIALITVKVAGESDAGHSRRVHRNHQASHSASHHTHAHAHRASRPQQHQSSPCDNGTGHPTDKGYPLGPVFQEQPVDTEFFEEQPDRTVTLHCCARANPPASYRWMLNSTEIEYSERFSLQGGNLVISDAERSLHSGQYQCEASNVAGSVLSNKATLHFIYLNAFPVERREQSRVWENKGAYLLCAPPPHSPGVKFEWLFDEDTNSSAPPAPVRLDSRRFVSQTTGNLYFSHVKHYDVGRYSCLLHRQIGPVLNKTVNSSFISLQLKKNSVGNRLAVRLEVRPPPTMDVLVGQKLRLECFGMGNPVPNITWHRPGALLLQAGPVLEIEEVQTSDNGTYRCNANNKLGNTSASTEVLVHARPQWTLGIVNANIHIGNDLYWSCNATGTPTPLYQWLRNGILLESKGRILVSRDDGRLKITSVHMGDEGMYQCVASNEHGEIYSSAQLRVLAFAPEFNHSHPTVVQAVRGGSVNIACALHAAPRPSISWGRGTESLPNSSKMTILENGSLAIRDLERSDHGSYTCFAMNSLGKANATVTLQVKDRTSITLAPSGASVTVGGQVTLQCRAIPDPSLDVAFEWKLHDRSIDTDDKNPHYSRKETVGDLVIRDVQLLHEGTYTCLAQTVVDTASAKADVVVRGPPGPPGGVKAVSVNATAVRVTWSHGADHHSPITSYTLECRSPLYNNRACVPTRTEPRNIEGDRESALVGDLKPWVEYEFKVVAHNACGRGNPSQPSQRIRTPGAVPTIVPSKIGGGGGVHRELTITWKSVEQEYRFGDRFTYNIRFRPLNSADKVWTTVVIGDADASRFVYKNASLEPYVPFEVQMQASNVHGGGPYSQVVVVHSAEDEPDVAPRRARAFPIARTACAVNYTEFKVTWEPILPNATSRRIVGYEIRYWKSTDNQAAAERVQTEFTNSVIIRGLVQKTLYHVEVRGYNTGGVGPPSPVASVHTNKNASSQIPEVRYTLKDDIVTIVWNPIHPLDESAVIKYQVRYHLKDRPKGKVYKVNTTETMLKVRLFAKDDYLVSVQALSASGEGPCTELHIHQPDNNLADEEAVATGQMEGSGIGGGASDGRAVWTTLWLCGLMQVLCTWSGGGL